MPPTRNFTRTLDNFAIPTKRVLGAILVTLVICSNSGYAHTTGIKAGHQHSRLTPGESIALKILINHLMNLLEPTTQEIHNTMSTLENDAILLITTYQTSQISSSLSSAEITAGRDDCDEAQLILNNPDSEIELSTSTAMDLEATIASIREDLENVY